MKLNPEQLTLKGIKQFVYKVDRHNKNQNILEVFQKCDNQNQTIIFVNSNNYGMILMQYLSKEGISVAIFMGHPMRKEERTAIINRFRKSMDIIIIGRRNQCVDHYECAGQRNRHEKSVVGDQC